MRSGDSFDAVANRTRRRIDDEENCGSHYCKHNGDIGKILGFIEDDREKLKDHGTKIEDHDQKFTSILVDISAIKTLAEQSNTYLKLVLSIVATLFAGVILDLLRIRGL